MTPEERVSLRKYPWEAKETDIIDLLDALDKIEVELKEMTEERDQLWDDLRHPATHASRILRELDAYQEEARKKSDEMFAAQERIEAFERGDDLDVRNTK